MPSRSRQPRSSVAIRISSARALWDPEAQSRIQAAVKRGFQTRDGEMALARLLGDLADGGSNT